MLVLDEFVGFDWDSGNRLKNFEKHGVSATECEEVFFNRPIAVVPDEAHSEREERYYVLGRTNAGRRLFVVFTARRTLVRVISARDMTKNERRHFPL